MEIKVEEFNILIAEAVNKRRFEMKISQRELARRSSLSHLKISIIEGSKGFEKQHGIFTLLKVFNVIDVKLSEIIKKMEDGL